MSCAVVRWRDATSFLLLTNDRSELVRPRTESTVCLNDEFCPSLTTSPARVKNTTLTGERQERRRRRRQTFAEERAIAPVEIDTCGADEND